MSLSNKPIIFLGMHRSGTTMFSQLMESLGLFVGTRRDENNEAVFFQNLNVWLMSQCGGRWDLPIAPPNVSENEEFLSCIEDHLMRIMNCPRVVQFLGLRRYLTAGGISRLDIPWGWKDPRNTFTLPLWLRVFPEAKVVYIERHGVDVAHSLKVRNTKVLNNSIAKYKKHCSRFPFWPKNRLSLGSARCASLEGGFSLWKEYTDQASDAMKQIPKHRILKLRYEHILENPNPFLREGAEFCGLEATTKEIKSISKNINKNKAYSYLSDSELCDFAFNHRTSLTKRGYE